MKLSTLNVAFVAIALLASQAIALPIIEGAVDQVDTAAYPRTTAPIEDKRSSSTTGTVKSIDFSVTPPTGSKTVAPGSKFDEDKNFDYGHYADPKWSTKREVFDGEREVEVEDKRAFGYIQATDPNHSSWRLLRRDDADSHDEASLSKKAFGYIWATSPKHATGDRDRRRDDVDSSHQDDSLAKKAFGYIWATSPKHATGDRNRRRDDLDASEVEARWLSAYVITKPKYSTGDHLRRRDEDSKSKDIAFGPVITSRFDTPADWWRSTFGDNGRRDADHMWDHGQKKPNFGWTPGGEGQGSFDDGRRAVEEEEES